MRERLALSALWAAFLGFQWAQLERPWTSLADIVVLAIAAIAPPALWAAGRRGLSVAALVAGIVVVVGIAYGHYPWETGHPFYLRRVWDAASDGVRGWLDTTTPIDIGRFPQAAADVELVFALLLAALAWLLVVLRRPLLAVGVGFAAFAVPTTMVAMGGGFARSLLFLILAALTLAACGPRALPRRGSAVLQVIAVGGCAIAAALILAAAPGVRKDAFLSWRTWNPLAGSAPRVSVGYVWNQDYKPFKWPKKKTEVFEVTAPKPMYWKAAVLSEFSDDRWQAHSVVQQVFPDDTKSIEVPLEQLPQFADPDSKDLRQASFRIKGLADPHLLAAGQPMAYSLDRASPAQLDEDGTAVLARDPAKDESYTARVYAPDPTPKDLTETSTDYPTDVRSTIEIGGVEIPAWNPDASASKRVQVPVDSALVAASNQVWNRSGAGEAKNPYEAVVAVESYFRDPELFTYDQTPRYQPGRPVLADFMLRAHAGYCQMYSGSMALVLRMHGIPARVAVGFTSGVATSSTSNTYEVYDRNAHSWVEVWFAGYGWLPFEPTPGRALYQRASTATPDTEQLSADFKSSGVTAVANTALAAYAARVLLPNGTTQVQGRNFNRVHGVGPGGNNGVFVVPVPEKHRSVFRWFAIAIVVVLAALLLAKWGAVRFRYLRRGPRAQASAAFAEMATFAGDQGVTVGAEATYEDLARRLQHAWGVDAFPFAKDASAARYAPRYDAEVAARRLRGHTRRMKREIRKNLELRDRAAGAIKLREAVARRRGLD
jgi:transglutaminase-like putative cysteine protease